MTEDAAIIRQLKSIVEKLEAGEDVIGIQQEIEAILSVIEQDETKARSLSGIGFQIKHIIKLLESSIYGLEEIKNEVRLIEETVLSDEYGLQEIKSEIRTIEDAVLNEQYGLEEIKREIRGIEQHLNINVTALTTGPIVADDTINSVVVKVLNNTAIARSVTILLNDLTDCPKSVAQSVMLTVPSRCAADFIFNKPPEQFEIEYDGVTTGVLVWSAGRSNGKNASIADSNFNPVNTFRHADHTPNVW